MASQSSRGTALQAWIWDGSGFELNGGVPVTDRGFRYGMSLFESFPVRGGVGIQLEEHWAKLREACGVVGFAVDETAFGAMPDLLKLAGDGFARIYVTAGDGPVTGDFDDCRILVFVEKREEIASRVYHRGYDLAMHAGGFSPVYAGLKTGNYWGNLRAFREGVAAHCNESLLFTAEGQLISASMANVFVLIGGRLITPEITTGARAGVMRDWVMGRADVEQGLVTRAQAENAEEIFLTSSWLGVMPCASVAGRTLPQREFATRLLRDYRKQFNDCRE